MALNFLNSGYFAGSVGIGVENPSKKLEVVGNTEVVGTLYVEAANNQIRLLDTNDSTVQFSVGANGTFQVRDVNASTTPFSIQKTAPDDSLVIKADGDVGINTSTPGTKLHIVGDSTLATQGTVLRVENTADVGSSQDIHIYNQYDRDIGIKFETLGGTNYIWQDSNSDDALLFTAGGNARATDSTLILEQDHNASFPLGSLGIGLTNPQVTLHVNGFARLNGGLQLDGNNRKILAIDDTDLGLGTNNTERMTITNNGGISFGSTGTAYGTSGQVLTSGGDASPTWTTPTTGTVTGTGSVNQVAFWTNTDSLSGTDKLYWDSTNDHLGIGDATPGSRLKVVSGSAETSIYTVDINHVRNNADVATHAMRLNVDFSGADTTTADRVSSALIIDLDSSADGDASDEHRIRGVNSDVRFTGFSDSVQSGYFLAESNNTTEKTALLMGLQAQASHDSSSTSGGVSNMYGVYGVSSIQDLGDVDNAFGGLFITSIPTSRGAANVGITKGVEGRVSIDKPDTITYGAMTAVSGIIDNNETTFPTFGNQYLFKGDYQGTKGGNAYGIYTEGDKHYFDGNIGIGATNPASRLSVGENGITTKIATVTIGDTTAGASLTLRGGSPTIYFDRTGADPQNKILMDSAGLEFKTGTLDAEGDVDFKINPDGSLNLANANLSNQENTDIDSAAAEVVAQVAISYTASFFDFVVKKGTNVRSGTVYACHDGTNVEFTETSTQDLGDTSDVTLSVDISGGNMRLRATTTSDDWSVKSLIRAI